MNSLVEQFLLEKRYNEGVSESTIVKYRFFFSLLSCSDIDLENPSTLLSRSFRLFLASSGSSRSWKPVTYNTARKVYRTYCNYLVREKIISSNPFDDLPKMREPQTLPKSLTSEQSKSLRYLLPKFFNLSSFIGFRNYAIFLTFLYTGIRRSELLNLLPSDFDRFSSSIFIRKGKMGKSRMVPVPDQLFTVLSDYSDSLPKISCRFFPSKNGNPLSERNLRTIFSLVSSKLQFTISPHRLRHTFATELVRNDFDIFNIASVLGHSSVRTTQIYLTADPARIGQKISSTPLYL